MDSMCGTQGLGPGVCALHAKRADLAWLALTNGQHALLPDLLHGIPAFHQPALGSHT